MKKKRFLQIKKDSKTVFMKKKRLSRIKKFQKEIQEEILTDKKKSSQIRKDSHR